DTLAREKWRYRKIARTLGLEDPLARRYLGLACAVRLDAEEEAFDYIEGCLELYQQIETRLVAHALHPSYPSILFPVAGGARPGAARALRRNPLVKMARQPDGTLVLVERQPLFRLRAPHSLVWLSVDGFGGERVETVEALVRAGGHDP